MARKSPSRSTNSFPGINAKPTTSGPRRLRVEAGGRRRTALAQAVQNIPGLTMQVLAQQAGVSVEQFLGMTPAQQQERSKEP